MLWIFRAAVLRKIPDPLPSIATLQQATTPEAKRDVLLRRPLITVNGSVAVEGTVPVDIENTPVLVEIVK